MLLKTGLTAFKRQWDPQLDALCIMPSQGQVYTTKEARLDQQLLSFSISKTSNTSSYLHYKVLKDQLPSTITITHCFHQRAGHRNYQ